MKLSIYFVAMLLIVFGSNASSWSQTGQGSTPTASKGTAEITGHITRDGNPVQGVRVFLVRDDGTPPFQQLALSQQGETDERGSYRLSGLPAGSFRLSVADPVDVVPREGRFGAPGKSLVIHEGDRISDVDLSLVSGGVITGRVTDAENRPIIGEKVMLESVDESARIRSFAPNNLSGETDDRGIYRLYGLPKGQYLISLRRRNSSAGNRVNVATGPTPKIYYPGVVNQQSAKMVKLDAGAEVQDINIVVVKQTNLYTVSGRVIDADSGKPVPHVGYTFNELALSEMSVQRSENQTDDDGNFRIVGVAPGRYSAYADLTNSENYSDVAHCDVRDSDVENVEIKIHNGATVSGNVQVEPAGSASVASRSGGLTVYASPFSGETPGIIASTQMQSDGAFTIKGVRPGKVRLFVSTVSSKPRLLRVEQNGVEQRDGITVLADQATTGIRLVLTYETASIRGQVTVLNGQLPAGARLIVVLERPGNSRGTVGLGQVDSQGKFLLLDVPSGTYELVASGLISAKPGERPIYLRPVRQPVTIVDGKDADVIMAVDIAQGIGNR